MNIEWESRLSVPVLSNEIISQENGNDNVVVDYSCNLRLSASSCAWVVYNWCLHYSSLYQETLTGRKPPVLSIPFNSSGWILRRVKERSSVPTIAKYSSIRKNPDNCCADCSGDRWSVACWTRYKWINASVVNQYTCSRKNESKIMEWIIDHILELFDNDQYHFHLIRLRLFLTKKHEFRATHGNIENLNDRES